MLFTSSNFFILLAITFVLYYLKFMQKRQSAILLISSFVFYSWHTPTLLFLLLISLFVNALLSKQLAYGEIKHLKLSLRIGLVFNLAVLFLFKYFKLFVNTFLVDIAQTDSWVENIVLPIGISFYTFQGISLIVDVYNRRNNSSELSLIKKGFFENFIHTGFYISFFPQLIAGPIMRSFDFLPQIGIKKFKDIEWHSVITLLITGYFLKMVVADNLKDITFYLEYPRFIIFSSYTLIMLLIAYSAQIFADFAGYSIIALGLARIFGYKLIVNFNFPYIAASFSEFWKRWHISLSTWLRDYLYIPLGGNKNGTIRTYINLFLVMFLGGLWHGAAWSYAAWGTFHGALLASERLFNRYFNFKIFGFFKGLKILFVFICVTLAWLLFKMPNFDDVVIFWQVMFSNWGLTESRLRIEVFIFLFTFPVFAYHLLYLFRGRWKMPASLKDFFMAFMLFMIMLNSGMGGAFIYFQF